MKFVKDRDTIDPVMPHHVYYFKRIEPYIKKKHVLDIGCWTGPLETLFEKVDCNVTGIDIKPEPLQFARRRFPKYRFVKANVLEKLPFKKNEFDAVVFSMVIEHIPKGTEVDALTNINKVVKKGGKILLTTMHSHPVSNLFDPAYFLTGHRHYSKKHLERLLRDSGFKIDKVYYNGSFYIIGYTWSLYFFKHILRRREPRGDWVKKILTRDYRNKGFNEIDIIATKVKEI